MLLTLSMKSIGWRSSHVARQFIPFCQYFSVYLFRHLLITGDRGRNPRAPASTTHVPQARIERALTALTYEAACFLFTTVTLYPSREMIPVSREYAIPR